MPALLRFANGAMVQIAQPANSATPVASTMAQRAATDLSSTLQQLDPFVSPICQHVRKLACANGSSTAEVKLGLSFTAEGDLYIVKGSAEVSVEITLTLDCKSDEQPQQNPV